MTWKCNEFAQRYNLMPISGVFWMIFFLRKLQPAFPRVPKLPPGTKKRCDRDGCFVSKYYLCCGFAINNEPYQS